MISKDSGIIHFNFRFYTQRMEKVRQFAEVFDRMESLAELLSNQFPSPLNLMSLVRGITKAELICTIFFEKNSEMKWW